jgi:hypothetical protein
VIVLDENIIDGQRLLLEGWNIPVRQVGLDVGHKGLKDEGIVVLLRRLRQPTFFTRDLGFYTPELRHQHYTIVAAAVGQYELASFVRRFLHHPEFDTYAKRAGKIIRIGPSGIACWQQRRQQEAFVMWETRT